MLKGTETVQSNERPRCGPEGKNSMSNACDAEKTPNGNSDSQGQQRPGDKPAARYHPATSNPTSRTSRWNPPRSVASCHVNHVHAPRPALIKRTNGAPRTVSWATHYGEKLAASCDGGPVLARETRCKRRGTDCVTRGPSKRGGEARQTRKPRKLDHDSSS